MSGHQRELRLRANAASVGLRAAEDRSPLAHAFDLSGAAEVVALSRFAQPATVTIGLGGRATLWFGAEALASSERWDRTTRCHDGCPAGWPANACRLERNKTRERK